MAFTDAPTKSATSRLLNDPALWNTYIKANLTEIKAHVDLTSVVHGLASGVYPVGCVLDNGYCIQGAKFEDYIDFPTAGGVRWQRSDWTFAVPYQSNPIVLMGIQYAAQDPNANDAGLWRWVRSMTPTGCQLDYGSIKDHINVVAYGIAIGKAADPTDMGYSWYHPKTYVDGELFPYADWNSFVRDNGNFLYHGHVPLTKYVHGLGPETYVAGRSVADQQVDAQRYPDPPPQTGNLQTVDHTFTFTRAFTGTPVVVAAAEPGGDPPAMEHHQHFVHTRSGNNINAFHTVGTDGGGPWYVEILAIGGQ